MTPVRFHEDSFELRCSHCQEWWPLTFEFWTPSLGLARCRACILEAKRIAYAKDPEAKRAAVRAYRACEPGIVHTIRWERVVQRRRDDPHFDAAYRAQRADATRRWRSRRKELAA